MHTLSRKGRSSASRLLHEKNVAPRRHAGDGGAPEGDGRASRRAPADAAAFGKRACAEASGPSRAGRPRPRGAPLPEGPLAGRATLRPARLPGLRHTGTGSGHIPKIQSLSDTPTGKGFQSQPPSGRRKSRRDALSANTATAPRGERLQTTFPAFSGKPAAHAGNGPPAGSHWRGRPPHRNGAGSAGGIRETQAPAARAGSGTPRASRKGNGGYL